MDFLQPVSTSGGSLQPVSGMVPSLFADAGTDATRRFIEFFTANIRNRNTRVAYVDAYLAVAQIAEDRKGPLFRSLDRERRLTKRRLHRLEVLAMIKRRARQASLPQTTCCHTYRATGITTYLQNGGTIEHAQQIANHESPRTTKLYDRTNDAISLDEIERILI